MRRTCCRRLSFVAALCLALACMAAPCLGAGPGGNVLILHSYHPSYAWTASVHRGMADEFAPHAPGPKLFVEYMNTKRHPPERAFPLLRDLYKSAYAGQHFDVILCSDDNALDFLLRYRNELFKGVPVVFTGINRFRPDRLAGHTGYTGVREEIDVRKMLDLILSLHPQVEHVAAVTDGTVSGRINQNLVHEAAADYKDRLTILELSNLSAMALRQRLRALPARSVVLNLSFAKDATGRFFSAQEGRRLIVESTDQPIYTAWDFFMGPGVVGGCMISGQSQGALAAQIALRILGGENPETIPVAKSPDRYLFDFEMLQKYDIDRQRLPEGSVVRNAPKPLLSRSEHTIWTVPLVIVLQAATIVLLVLAMLRRKAAERAAKKAEERYRGLFEHALEGLFQSTPDGRFLHTNPAYARMLGYETPEALMAAADDIGHQFFALPEERTRLLELLAENKSVTGYEVRMRRRDGSFFWVAISARAVFDEKGAMSHLEGFSMDISSRREAEEELEEMNRHLEALVEERTEELNERAREFEMANVKLQELDRLKSIFLSTVSHELRTPLTSILGFAKLISKDFSRSIVEELSFPPDVAKKVERIVENLTIIQREGERLTRLINDFLDLSRIESGKMDWRETEVRPEVTIYQAMEAVRGQFEALPEVALSVDLPETLPMLYVDADRLQQVVVNLLSNAAKHTRSGSVRVSAMAVEDGRALRIEVADTGRGIPAEHLDRIFNQFHQADRGDTLGDHPPGSGLGLAICRQIVEHYDGRIWAESTLGRGSTFILELPTSAPPEHHVPR